MLERREREVAKVGLKINVNKSKKMHIAMNETLCIHSEATGRVTQFAYLGNIMDNTSGTEADTTAHIRKAQIAFSTLNKIWHSTERNFASSAPT
jgi:hypothetical protein